MLLCSHFSTSLELFSLLYMLKYMFLEVLYQRCIYITFIFILIVYVIFCCCSVAQSCHTLCDPMDCTTPGFPVLHHFPELSQTHVHSLSDAIQPSHPLSFPSAPAFNLSQHRVFSNESALLIRWPKYLSFSFSISPSNEYSGFISFRIGLADLIFLQSKGLSRMFSNKTLILQHSALFMV